MTSCMSDTSKAQCWWALANSYSAAADQLLENPSGQVFVPLIYLLGHSLELNFKAFLISQGAPEKKLKSREFGHDLVACLRECKKQGLCKHLPLTSPQVRQIVKVNRYYQEKHLEYFTATAKRFGSVESFRNIVSQTSRAVFNLITEEDFRALSRNET